MARKTATAVKEDLFGGKAAPAAKPKQAVATVVSSKAPVSQAPKTLIERLKEVSDSKDVAIAREILAMIRSEEDRNASRAFDEKMLACQGEIPPITRSSFNKHTKSHWAKLEKISRIADPIIRKHGFTLSYGMETSPIPNHYRVICDVSNGGCTRRYFADVGMDHLGPKGEGNKSLAQGSGSSITYARRYLKVMIFDIVIEGEDNDGNGARQIGEQVDDALVSADQVATLAKAIADNGVGVPRFLEKYDITQVKELPARLFDKALTACRNFSRDTKGADRG